MPHLFNRVLAAERGLAKGLLELGAVTNRFLEWGLLDKQRFARAELSDRSFFRFPS